jgi:hypothetical protein
MHRIEFVVPQGGAARGIAGRWLRSAPIRDDRRVAEALWCRRGFACNNEHRPIGIAIEVSRGVSAVTSSRSADASAQRHDAEPERCGTMGRAISARAYSRVEFTEDGFGSLPAPATRLPPAREPAPPAMPPVTRDRLADQVADIHRSEPYDAGHAPSAMSRPTRTAAAHPRPCTVAHAAHPAPT